MLNLRTARHMPLRCSSLYSIKRQPGSPLFLELCSKNTVTGCLLVFSVASWLTASREWMTILLSRNSSYTKLIQYNEKNIENFIFSLFFYQSHNKMGNGFLAISGQILPTSGFSYWPNWDPHMAYTPMLVLIHLAAYSDPIAMINACLESLRN